MANTTTAMVKATAKKAARAKSGVHLETSRFGTPTPTYYLVRSAVASMNHRDRNAALYRLAAEIEEAIPAGDGWVVGIDRDRACVSLELVEGDAQEAADAMAILRRVERL